MMKSGNKVLARSLMSQVRTHVSSHYYVKTRQNGRLGRQTHWNWKLPELGWSIFVVLMCFPLPHVALSMIPLINHDLFDKMYIAPALLAHRPAGDSFMENLLFPSFSIPVSFCTA